MYCGFRVELLGAAIELACRGRVRCDCALFAAHVNHTPLQLQVPFTSNPPHLPSASHLQPPLPQLLHRPPRSQQLLRLKQRARVRPRPYHHLTRRQQQHPNTALKIDNAAIKIIIKNTAIKMKMAPDHHPARRHPRLPQLARGAARLLHGARAAAAALHVNAAEPCLQQQ